MEEEIKKRLFQKGWSKEEVEHASHIVNNPKEGHFHIKRNLHLTGYWFLMLGLVALNVVAVVFMIPLILLINLPWIYFVAIIAGLGCGLIFNWLVLEIEHLEHEHHLAALLIVPLLTLLDVIVIYVILDDIKNKVVLSYNPDPVVFYFGLCFILPYFIWFVLGQHTKKNKATILT